MVFWRLSIPIALLLLIGTAIFRGEFVRAESNPGNQRFDLIPSGQRKSLPAQQTIITIFFDDAEGGMGGWTAGGMWQQVANPQLISLVSAINPPLVTLPDSGSLPPAFSGVTAWWFGEEATGSYIGTDFQTIFQASKDGGRSTGPVSGALTSPVVTLPANLISPTLTFRTWWEIESVDADRSDRMIIELSAGGGSFSELRRLNPAIDVDGPHAVPYSSGGFNQAGQWQTADFDLSPYLGSDIQLGFRFDSGDEQFNGFRGWLIDDIRVWGIEPFPVSPPSSDSGSSSSPTATPLPVPTPEPFAWPSQLPETGYAPHSLQGSGQLRPQVFNRQLEVVSQ